MLDEEMKTALENAVCEKCTGRMQDKEMRRIMKENCFASLNAKMQKCRNAAGYLPMYGKRKPCCLRLPLPLPPFLYQRLFERSER